MGLLSSRREEVMGSYILTELRDLRKGMEGRDGELRGEIAAVRDAVATLSESVSRSHTNVEAIKTDLDSVTTDVKRLREDLDDIQQNTTISNIKNESAWNGPKRVLGFIVAVGAAAAAFTTIVKFWPILIGMLVAM